MVVTLINLLPRLVPGAFRPSRGAGKVYLTFDDGPTPGVTPWVLDTLDYYGAKGTFFCIGRNVEAHPAIYEDIVARGHSVGNHTYGHLRGWATSTGAYVADVERASTLVRSDLFRPPYGRIRPGQLRFLRRSYRVVLWDVLAWDFDTRLSPGRCAARTLGRVKAGDVVCFHDSLKAQPRMRYVLPLLLEKLKKDGLDACGIE